jgi:16S rRNA (guanine(966)-N(2))-methyltransferase RsmD
MTRIVAGTRGGRRLAAPPGTGTRPTSDRVREALFSTLESMAAVEGSRFADLFAGSGAVGLEAASRGARAVLLVESDPRAARVIRGNIASLELGAVCRLRASTVASALAAPAEEPFDVVFADPPYAVGEDELAALLDSLVAQDWLAPDGVVVIERSSRTPEPRWPLYVTSHRAKRYGESMLWYGRRA